jgi:hypothetical protein
MDNNINDIIENNVEKSMKLGESLGYLNVLSFVKNLRTMMIELDSSILAQEMHGCVVTCDRIIHVVQQLKKETEEKFKKLNEKLI